jgi:prepilin-type N-terminal cleavage/methylation domain-containing protein
MFQVFTERLHRRRRAFTLIELVVAMAIVLILGGVAYATYIGQVANSRTAALNQYFAQIYTGMMAAQANSASGAFPTDASNVAGTANTGESSYDALVTDLASAGAANLPATTAGLNMVAADWTYEPVNSTNPATFTIVGQATGGNGHVLCIDSKHGVVDLGSGGAPATVGVSCQ